MCLYLCMRRNREAHAFTCFLPSWSDLKAILPVSGSLEKGLTYPIQSPLFPTHDSPPQTLSPIFPRSSHCMFSPLWAESELLAWAPGYISCGRCSLLLEASSYWKLALVFDLSRPSRMISHSTDNGWVSGIWQPLIQALLVLHNYLNFLNNHIINIYKLSVLNW